MVSICICTYTHTDAHAYTHIYTHTHVHTHIYTHAYTHTYTHAHMYTHTYTHRDRIRDIQKLTWRLGLLTSLYATLWPSQTTQSVKTLNLRVC